MTKKNNHTYKTIFTWFGNLPTPTELQGFHYYQERIQSAVTMMWYSSKNTTTHKTLITKVGFTMGYRPKPPLHGLSLSKSPIENNATLFGLDWVVKPDQTKLGSTKPNNLQENVSCLTLNGFAFYRLLKVLHWLIMISMEAVSSLTEMSWSE